jgi:hypothetical protein
VHAQQHTKVAACFTHTQGPGEEYSKAVDHEGNGEGKYKGFPEANPSSFHRQQPHRVRTQEQQEQKNSHCCSTIPQIPEINQESRFARKSRASTSIHPEANPLHQPYF